MAKSVAPPAFDLEKRIVETYRNISLHPFDVGGNKHELRMFASDVETNARRVDNERRPEDCKLVAVDTGDGWCLQVENPNGECMGLLEWPKHWNKKSAKDLKEMGYEVI